MFSIILIVFFALLGLVVGAWMQAASEGSGGGCGLILLVIVAFFAALVLGAMLLFSHATGDREGVVRLEFALIGFLIGALFVKP